MKAIKKLKSNRGATIIFAMAIFLVAVVISASLVTVSLTATKSSASQLEDEQAYLAVASAARIFQKKVEGKNVIITKEGATTTASIDGVTENNPDPIDSTLIFIAGLDPTGNVPDPENIIVTSPAELSYDVVISMKVKNDYSFDAIFTSYKKGKPDKKIYSATMHFNAFVGAGSIKDINGTAVKNVTKVRWSIYGEDTKRGKANGTT